MSLKQSDFTTVNTVMGIPESGQCQLIEIIFPNNTTCRPNEHVSVLGVGLYIFLSSWEKSTSECVTVANFEFFLCRPQHTFRGSTYKPKSA